MFLKQQLWEKNAKPSWNGKTYGNPWKKPLKASKSIADAVVKPSQKPMAAASLTTILASLSWGMWECRLPPPWCGCSLSGTRKSWRRPVFFFFSVRRLAAPPWSEYVLYIYDNMYIYIIYNHTYSDDSDEKSTCWIDKTRAYKKMVWVKIGYPI